jgi:hypothetical protein
MPLFDGPTVKQLSQTAEVELSLEETILQNVSHVRCRKAGRYEKWYDRNVVYGRQAVLTIRLNSSG